MGRVPLLGWGRLVAGCPEEREVRATVRNKGGRRREKFLVKSNNCIGEGRKACAFLSHLKDSQVVQLGESCQREPR